MNGCNRRAVVCMAALMAVVPARSQRAAVPSEVAAAPPAARQQGNGTLRFIGLRVYDARLWIAERPISTDWISLPFALELEYLRALDGEQIADRSLVEMRRQGEIAAEPAARWLAAMKKMFPDVKAGDRITGLNLPGEGVRFFINGTARGDVKDTDFARFFFGIWLSPKTSEPGLREGLLGKGK